MKTLIQIQLVGYNKSNLNNVNEKQILSTSTKNPNWPKKKCSQISLSRQWPDQNWVEEKIQKEHNTDDYCENMKKLKFLCTGWMRSGILSEEESLEHLLFAFEYDIHILKG